MRSFPLATMGSLFLFLALLAGCASLDPAAAVLDKYPGVKQQIMSYYNSNATEDSWGCNAVYMDNITEAKVIRETPEQLVLGVHYFFISDFGGGRRGPGCEGFGTRVFTFARSGGSYGLVSMSGEQRGNS